MNLHQLKYLSPKAILDIGANAGFWAKEAQEVWPDSNIFLIEGNPECEPALKATLFPYVIALLADEEKEVVFYQRKCGGTSTGDSMYREDTPWYNDENVVETKMKTRTLDSMFAAGMFDLIKIDTQASELDILKGGKRVVGGASAIIMEVPVDGPKPYNIGAPTRSEVMEYMTSIGFVNHQILEDIVHPLTRIVIQQDILFTR